MTFDDELKRAFESLGDRLHAEVQHQIDAAMAELQSAAVPRAAIVPPPPPLPVAAAGADVDASILEGIRAIDAARSLTDILDALAAAAARHADGVDVRLRRAGGWQSWRTIGIDSGRDEHEAVRLAIAISGETIGELYAEGASPAAVEILARHAARALESMTAFKTARALARQTDAAPAEQVGEEDASAQRYAKLLVSEIKLYHEPEVLAGRRARDLGSRLGGEIARARTLYDQRVPPHVRERVDYFRDELVRTLANGDSSLLELRT